MLLELDRGDGEAIMIFVCLLEIHGKCYYYSNTNIWKKTSKRDKF